MKVPSLLIAFFAPLMAMADAYFTANFANSIPSTFTLVNADGGELQPNVYSNIGNNKEVAWTAAQLGNGYGRAALSPTRNANPSMQSENWMILPTVNIADAEAVLRWEARSMHRHLNETYNVMVREQGTTDWSVLYACDGERYNFTTHAISLNAYLDKNVEIAFVATTFQGFMLAVDNIFVGVPTDDVFVFYNETIHYASEGESTINGTLTYYGNTSKWSSVTLEGFDEPLSITLPSLHCGESVVISFNPTLDKGTTYTYQIKAVSDDGETLICDDFISCSDYSRMHVIDKATGTWCINCPTMELTTSRLERLYGEQLLVLEAHVNDAMTNESYWSEYLSEGVFSIPALIPNHDLDKLIFSLKDSENFSDALAKDTHAKITITDVSRQGNEVTVSTVAEFAHVVDNSDDNYRIAYMLIADIHNDTDGRYLQHSMALTYRDEQYYYMPDYILPELMYYDNVPVEASVAYSGVPMSLPTHIEPSTQYAHHFNMQVSDDTSYSNLRAVSLLIDRQSGEVINASVAPVGTGAISDFINDTNDTNALYYDITGRRVADSATGIIITRTANKTTKKINIQH